MNTQGYRDYDPNEGAQCLNSGEGICDKHYIRYKLSKWDDCPDCKAKKPRKLKALPTVARWVQIYLKINLQINPTANIDTEIVRKLTERVRVLVDLGTSKPPDGFKTLKWQPYSQTIWTVEIPLIYIPQLAKRVISISM